jgi:hypothetical protein
MSQLKKPGRGVPKRYLLVSWVLVLSAVAFMDRTNISIAGVSISRQFGIDNAHLGWVFSAFLTRLRLVPDPRRSPGAPPWPAPRDRDRRDMVGNLYRPDRVRSARHPRCAISCWSLSGSPWRRARPSRIRRQTSLSSGGFRLTSEARPTASSSAASGSERDSRRQS